MSYDDEITAEESHSHPHSLKCKALKFLSKSGPEGRDAARGKQVLMFRAYLGHQHCGSLDCPVCISVLGSGLRVLQWVQNQAFSCGVFCPSSEIEEHRKKRSSDWTEYMSRAESAKDFERLPIGLREAIKLDIQHRMPPPKPKPRGTGIEEGNKENNLDKKKA